MGSITAEIIRERLRQVKGPDCDSDIVSLGLLSDIFIADGKVFFSITIPNGRAQEFEPLRCAAEKAVNDLEGIRAVVVTLTAEKEPKVSSQGHKGAFVSKPGRRGVLPTKMPIDGVRHVIAVASGKGGVGKSTTAINIALALQDAGFRTGLMDADIYGPSLPRLTGLVNRKVQQIEGKKIQPLNKFGLQLMSMGFLVDEEKPMVWRGPMVMAAVTQFLRDVVWGPLDILVIDLPPGTGDVQLTLSQQVQLTGALIVSTPQDLSLVDVRKAVEMFMKVDIPILGFIENMSYFIAPDTGKRYDIFGYGGVRMEAENRGIPLLAEIPLDASLRTSSDEGLPIFIADFEGKNAGLYRSIVHKIRDKFF
ncbi:Mrp/NBP35 family ATP-binding protein [Bartonella ancashensis]|uniref:Iron-sulfur cluster carrier protein n=1 Tax=Bartonella ancashensis TaxID=1318743 RepID=A0A0M4L6X8_9HYPH|nr:Mrp/NBP35 family ATP-binding protein [Bartonella ancashensis]ALE03533.1 Scaffold protein for [4Fe-4S] cluster assembly ApbC, MRP-like [Bartonella ancashensis]